MCWKKEFRLVGKEIQAKNVDIHGFSHCVYSQVEPRGGEGRWYPLAGYHKYARDGEMYVGRGDLRSPTLQAILAGTRIGFYSVQKDEFIQIVRGFRCKEVPMTPECGR